MPILQIRVLTLNSSEVVVQVWLAGEENVLTMEWFVSLPALTYLADKV